MTRQHEAATSVSRPRVVFMKVCLRVIVREGESFRVAQSYGRV